MTNRSRYFNGLLGASPFQVLARIVVPCVAPGIASAVMLSFITSLDDFVTSYFLSGVGGTTLPTYIYSMLKLEMTTEINAASTLLAIATCGIVAAGYWLAQVKIPGGEATRRAETFGPNWETFAGGRL